MQTTTTVARILSETYGGCIRLWGYRLRAAIRYRGLRSPAQLYVGGPYCWSDEDIEAALSHFGKRLPRYGLAQES